MSWENPAKAYYGFRWVLQAKGGLEQNNVQSTLHSDDNKENILTKSYIEMILRFCFPKFPVSLCCIA